MLCLKARIGEIEEEEENKSDWSSLVCIAWELEYYFLLDEERTGVNSSNSSILSKQFPFLFNTSFLFYCERYSISTSLFLIELLIFC